MRGKIVESEKCFNPLAVLVFFPIGHVQLSIQKFAATQGHRKLLKVDASNGAAVFRPVSEL